MKTLDIGLDVDNVLYPYATVIARWTERRKGLPPGTLDDLARSWTWYEDQWGITHEEFMEHFRSGVHAGVIFTEGDPVEGSLAAVRRLHSAGHRLHYVTNRAIPGVSEDHAWQATHRWLHDHGFPVDSLTVAADKNVVPTDVFLDDSPDNIRALLLNKHPHPLLWDRPHNQGAVLCEAHCVTRIRSWPAFERVVETIAKMPAFGAAEEKRTALAKAAA